MSTVSKMKKVFEEKKLSGDGRGRKSKGKGSSRTFRGFVVAGNRERENLALAPDWNWPL